MSADITLMVVYGTRPEAIKVAPVIEAGTRTPGLRVVPVVTGQHREMLREVNDLFGIVPEHDLDIMRQGQTLADVAARVLSGLDPVLAEVRPDAVLVQGDTTTSTAAALAAFYRKVPVIHLEAGLRSHDLASPFPEEANRLLTSQVTALHLAPTAGARENLVTEGVEPQTVVVTGNTVIDALHHAVERGRPVQDTGVARAIDHVGPVLLVTAHRRESWGEPMLGIARALARLARSRPELMIVFPLHRNPAVRAAVLPEIDHLPNVVTTEPLMYDDFVQLLGRATVVLTDSGGVQEEAPSLGKPVLVMRETTERPEAVAAGTVRLVGVDEGGIVSEVTHLLDDERAYSAMSTAVNPYGDGRAAARVIAATLHHFGVGAREPDFEAAPV